MKKIKVYGIRYLSPYDNYLFVEDVYKSYLRFLFNQFFLYVKGIDFSTQIYFILDK
ncbi:hypothetical protein [Sulfurospirillum oryzae]|uniref:hypothetical protein n=1 Tax=Sulfurospirillum oryzae TaxID=2976535 RepID=UPI0021E8C2C9|nr:hypothetical protein [Sulfurospirillum oryzae]